ncbi:MAG: efflux RND transporter periplasmic adaptor subunit [Nannocystaceae bacterium]
MKPPQPHRAARRPVLVRRAPPQRRLAALLTPLALALAAAGCGGPGSNSWAAEGKREADAALKVATTSLQPRSLVRHYQTSGTLRARRAADLVAMQPGLVEALLAEEGGRVAEGDVLARLDGRSSALQAAQAGLQLQNLQRELERLEAVQGGAVSKEEIDKQRYLVEEARAALKLSKHQVGLTVVRAPFDGTITARHVDVGALAGATTPLFSIADLRELELDLHLPERDAATVQPDAEVEITLVDGSSFVAKIVRRAPVVDAATGTVKFIARAREFPPAAAPGAFARARVLVESHANAPSLPRSAVFEVEGKPHVYVIEDGKARRRPVEVRMTGEDAVEIASGIGSGDIVVADGNAGITEGMPLSAAGEAAAAKPVAGGG